MIDCSSEGVGDEVRGSGCIVIKQVTLQIDGTVVVLAQCWVFKALWPMREGQIEPWSSTSVE